jgi:two-component system OmpR family response regulator
MRILIAEDDPGLGAAVAFVLERMNGHAVERVHDGLEADRALQARGTDLLILDIGLPGLSGFEVLRRMRSRNCQIPVLIMSGRPSEEDKLRGFDLGADDYVVKPFGVRELEARVRALLRRSHGAAGDQLVRGGLCFDVVRRTATVEGRPLPLSAREAAVFELLLREFGRVVSKERLVSHVYTRGEAPGDNAVEVSIHRLRKKLAVSPVVVRTLHGIGYQLDHRDSVH